MNEPSPFATNPSDRSGRWTWLQEVIRQWYSPLQSTDGVSGDDLDSAESRLGIVLPRALRKWYGLAGCRNDIWSCQDRFLQPGGFAANGDYLVFLIENQQVVEFRF